MTYRDIVDKHNKLRCTITDHTRWNGMNYFSPAEMDKILRNNEECHRILRELTGISDWQAPFRLPPLREQAIELLKEVV